MMAALLLFLVSVAAAQDHIALVLDQSCSMLGNDKPKYTVQFSKILADLLEPDDHLYVNLVPTGGSCNDRLPPNHSFELGRSRSLPLKSAVERYANYGGNNNYGPAVRKSRDQLGLAPARHRMLLVIADSDWWSTCTSQSSALVRELEASGAYTAFVYLGGSPGPFRSFDGDLLPARSARELLEQMGVVYQNFLGAKKPVTGSINSNTVEVTVNPYVRQAYLVVTGDGKIGGIDQHSGNPGARRVDLNHATDQTVGLDRVTRQYRIVRLERPQAGRWRFRLGSIPPNAAYMLIEHYSLNVRMTTVNTEVPQGRAIPLAVELVDEETGHVITDPGAVPGLTVEIEIDGQRHTLRPDPKNPGQYTTDVTFNTVGKKSGTVKMTTAFNQREEAISLDVVPVHCALHAPLPEEIRLGESVSITATILDEGSVSARPPDHVVATPTGSAPINLIPTPLNYTGRWSPTSTGKQSITITTQGGDTCVPVQHTWTVLDHAPALQLQAVPHKVPEGQPASLSLALLDQPGGVPIHDAGEIEDLSVTIEIAGVELSLTEDPAAPGIFSVEHNFPTAGTFEGRARLRTRFRDVDVPFPLTVVPVRCALQPRLPANIEADRPQKLVVVAADIGEAPIAPPNRVLVETPASSIELLDDGIAPDDIAGDRYYTGTWSPHSVGTAPLRVSSEGGDLCPTVTTAVEVAGWIELAAAPIALGALKNQPCPGERGRCITAILDLTGAEIHGDFDIALTIDTATGELPLEIKHGGEWVALSSTPFLLSITHTGPRSWPVRMRAQNCCWQSRTPEEPWTLSLQTTAPSGPANATAPVTASLTPDPVMHCLWPGMMIALAIATGGFVVAGVVWPSRFTLTMKLALSEEATMSEPYLSTIRRTYQHTGHRFYRDAAIWLCDGHLIHGRGRRRRPATAIALLRVDGPLVRITPVRGRTVEERTLDGEWVPLPTDESPLVFNKVYRVGGHDNYFFSLRRS